MNLRQLVVTTDHHWTTNEGSNKYPKMVEHEEQVDSAPVLQYQTQDGEWLDVPTTVIFKEENHD